MKDYLYLDYAANTPVDEEVLKTFNDSTLKYFANPNATHGLGVYYSICCFIYFIINLNT